MFDYDTGEEKRPVRQRESTQLITDGGRDLEFPHHCDECGMGFMTSEAKRGHQTKHREEPDHPTGDEAEPVTDGGRVLDESDLEERDVPEEMWWCAECSIWVGWKLDRCLEGHERPAGATTTGDVDQPDDYCLVAETRRERTKRFIRHVRRGWF